jgi:hypothetical protein
MHQRVCDRSIKSDTTSQTVIGTFVKSSGVINSTLQLSNTVKLKTGLHTKHGTTHGLTLDGRVNQIAFEGCGNSMVTAWD